MPIRIYSTVQTARRFRWAAGAAAYWVLIPRGDIWHGSERADGARREGDENRAYIDSNFSNHIPSIPRSRIIIKNMVY